jgi:hypothetical protein
MAFVKTSDALFEDLQTAVEERFRQKLQSFVNA